MGQAFSRSQRVAGQIRRDLATIIQLDMSDPRLGMVTISDVEVTKDLSFADVYVSFLVENTSEKIAQSVQVLQDASGFLRTSLAKKLKVRTTPKLRFHYDGSIQNGAYLRGLIDQVAPKEEREEVGSSFLHQPEMKK